MNDRPEHPAPIVFHIPHASTRIPPDVRPQLILSDAELDLELLRTTDLHTDTVFAAAAQDGDAVVNRAAMSEPGPGPY